MIVGESPRHRGRWLAAGLAVVAAAAVLGGWRAGVFTSSTSPGTGELGAPATQAVVRENIAATTPVSATLGYGGSYPVTGQGAGTLTWLPRTGRTIRQGQVLYRVDNGSPVVLLYGSVPAWRALDEGVSGADVAQLNRDLVRLGYASGVDVGGPGWDYYSWATAAGVQLLEDHLGVSDPPGSLALGQVVFKPVPIRVTEVTGGLGGPASGPVLQATSDQHVVMIPLDVSQEGEVQAGDRVTVTLPDGTSTPGVIASVGTVATTSQSDSGNGTATTIPVTATLTEPGAAGSLDQAPVTVYITTAAARDVLAVPVTALLARSPGQYVVEIAGPGSVRRYVPVTPGIFDDASGQVQVTGALSPGQRVVIAAT
jgi:hypothetical protein